MELGFKVGDKVKVIGSRYFLQKIGIVGKVISIEDIDDDGDIQIIVKPDNSQAKRVFYVGNWGDVLEKVNTIEQRRG